MRFLILSSLFVKLTDHASQMLNLSLGFNIDVCFYFATSFELKIWGFHTINIYQTIIDHINCNSIRVESKMLMFLRRIFAVSHNNRMDRISYSLVLQLRTMQTPDKTVWLHSMMLANGLQSANFDDKYSSNWMNLHYSCSVRHCICGYQGGSCLK